MAPLIVLVVVTGLARLLGALGLAAFDATRPALVVGLAAMFCLSASAHFLQPRRAGLIAMVPPVLPRPALLVSLTGVLELAGAAGLLITSTSHAAAACLGLLLIALFPANVHAARAGVRLAGRPSTPLLLRTGIQLIFLTACAVAAVT